MGTPSPGQFSSDVTLGIETGGTRTSALSADDQDREIALTESGPANLKLISDADLESLFRSIAPKHPTPRLIGIGSSGARTTSDRQRISSALAKVWPSIPNFVADDLQSAWHACGKEPPKGIRVLALSGTGSCCYGRNAAGTSAKTSGWGHVLGDRGSGYVIVVSALRGCIYEYDRTRVCPEFARRVLTSLQMNDPDELIDWVQSAPKAEISKFAPVVFELAKGRDRIARETVEEAAKEVGENARNCALRLGKAGTTAEFFFSGSVLLKQPAFQKKVAKIIRERFPKATFAPLKLHGAWGAIRLARSLHVAGTKNTNHRGAPKSHSAPPAIWVPPLDSLGQSPTELRNPRSKNLDRLPTATALELMLREDALIPGAILAHKREISRLIDRVAKSLRSGGRLFYVGAGTSGRLGILDASECPPTFRTDPALIQGIIAGGPAAVRSSVEGAEDNPKAGADAIAIRKVTAKDVVIGIAASGRTPFVWGALDEARDRKAYTALVCFNPSLRIPKKHRPSQIVAIDVGPEILTGSTRLKSGTATKLVLNTITTLAMVRNGKVIENLMIDLNPSNEKLKRRAIGILDQLTKAGDSACEEALESADWNLKNAHAALRGKRRR